MYNRLILFVNKHYILSEAQNAFRGIKSTGTTSQAFIKTIQEAMDQCIQVVGTFLELTKAYDFLNHNTLLDKLDSYGIRDNMNLWFKSFLFNRSKFVGKTAVEHRNMIEILTQEKSAWFATRLHFRASFVFIIYK